ncbi:MAG TPA: diacylglycerol kinase family protein [Microbacterium sp.]|uniref:diacylglycerol/lipid kinase family protein n=1 Tax=Microbacterium sp. TaxID=51671 RepID=UPI002B496C48|nr:diacylglycerol kinase family protein [Microbacterium sp.]HKT55668.1 diacylglycerol kinase family protein [Microbacterium sp.]
MGADGAKRAALVYNPIKVDGASLRHKLVQFSRRAGWADPIFHETTVDDLGQDATHRALAEGVDAVLVAGGDGTVRAVSATMMSTGIPLTIVPSGTGNVLARNLKLPLTDLDAVIEATFSGEHRAIDIGTARITRADGTVEDEAFVVMAGIGLDAAMIANTRSHWKKRIGWIAYIDGAARALPNAQPFRAVYQLDSRRLHTVKVHSMLFTNCGTLPAGIELVPDAAIDDGVLDVALFQPTGWFGWVGVWRKVWWDNTVLRRTRAGRRIVQRRKNTSVHYLRGAAIETAPVSPQPIELDGDEFGEAVRLLCRIVPEGLIVALPR